MNGQSTIITDEDLFAGFGSYVANDEVGLFEDGMSDAAFTPVTPSSWPCAQLVTSIILETYRGGC